MNRSKHSYCGIGCRIYFLPTFKNKMCRDNCGMYTAVRRYIFFIEFMNSSPRDSNNLR